ncbi:MAG: pseudouridine synthase, partial [Chitinophagales bacterium]
IESREVSKKYIALVEGNDLMQEGTLENWLLKDVKAKRSIAVKPNTKNARQAILHYKILQKNESTTMLEIGLETGRYHQVRCQFAHIGHPVVNDIIYGAKQINSESAICLHATSYTIMHPMNTQQMIFYAATPESEIWNVHA